MDGLFDDQLLGTRAPHKPMTSLELANTESDLDNATGPFGVPLHLIRTMIQEPYDALWLMKIDVDPESIRVNPGDSNLLRFYDLYKAGALQEGDEIYHRGFYQVNGQTVELDKVARLTGVSKGAGGRKCPSLVVLSEGSEKGELPFCRGPKDIAKMFNEIQPQEPVALKDFGIWRQLCVRRGDMLLGSIHDVRNALFAWHREMDAWAQSEEMGFRKRSFARKKPAVSPHQDQPASQPQAPLTTLSNQQTARYHPYKRAAPKDG
ncbi:MAG: hypothetical protein Q9174_005928 [Haloplaca sp. 1 TL-2023]